MYKFYKFVSPICYIILIYFSLVWQDCLFSINRRSFGPFFWGLRNPFPSATKISVVGIWLSSWALPHLIRHEATLLVSHFISITTLMFLQLLRSFTNAIFSHSTIGLIWNYFLRILKIVKSHYLMYNMKLSYVRDLKLHWRCFLKYFLLIYVLKAYFLIHEDN